VHRLIALAVLAVAATWVRIAIAGRARPAPPGDTVAVFGAPVVDGRPSRELAGRLDYAAELWKERRAPEILCLGGDDGPAAMRTHLLSRGVPAEALRVDGGSHSTRDEIGALRRLAPGRRVLAVSSPYHMLRIASEARRQGVSLATCPPPVGRVTLSSATRLRQTAREVVALWWYALTPPLRDQAFDSIVTKTETGAFRWGSFKGRDTNE
jgi:uncharacterized SAM-binding protein YcdF (DUF218 family)